MLPFTWNSTLTGLRSGSPHSSEVLMEFTSSAPALAGDSWQPGHCWKAQSETNIDREFQPSRSTLMANWTVLEFSSVLEELEATETVT